MDNLKHFGPIQKWCMVIALVLLLVLVYLIFAEKDSKFILATAAGVGVSLLGVTWASLNGSNDSKYANTYRGGEGEDYDDDEDYGGGAAAKKAAKKAVKKKMLAKKNVKRAAKGKPPKTSLKKKKVAK